MIQRIQSLYLLLATALMGVALLAPVASFTVSTGDVFTLSAFSLSSVAESQSTIWMGILMVVATVLPLVTLFLFKRRMLQVRLCAVEIVLLLGCIAFEAIYFWLSGANALEELVVEHRHLGWAAIMPIVSLVFTALAARATFKDEVMVRSFDRIR
ncbi:MAG: DUF4293 domain-containing protein [Alistipes sp.]|nr:DUF4293 domain-containing protein [Alistipes sp.]